MTPAPHPLIGPEEVARRLNDPALVLLDATFTLPSQGRQPALDFEGAHLGNARFFDIDTIADRSSALPHMLPDPEQFALEVGRLGIDNDKDIVIYDDNCYMASARGWWMFRIFGHERVRVMDGGLHRWRQLGLPVTSSPLTPRPATFMPQFRPELVTDFETMRRLSEDGSRCIIDARPEGRFKGLEAEPREGLRSGHIPGSQSLFFKRLLDPDTQCFLDPASLSEMYKATGALSEQSVVATCGSGVTAAILALGLAILGRMDTAIYDGSWSEWGQPGPQPVAKT